MPTRPHLARMAVAALAVALVPNMAADADGGPSPRDQRLLGRAVLPALTVAPGPSSGAEATPANGVTFPIEEGQIVAGFSAIVEGDQPGQYLAMPDNGFGSKGNSADFLIRAYTIEPDFKTAGGGSGSVVVRDWIQFRDPYERFGFPIVNDGTIGRLLTGADIDPESMQRDANGDLWVGDEFGPWILHFSADGVLLDAPIPLPGGLQSPNHPDLDGEATQPNSRGIEGMGISGRYLYPILEGATVDDLTRDPTRRLVFEYDTRRRDFTGRQWDYRVDPATAFVSDVAPLSRHELVVVERDGMNPGVQRDVYVVDLRRVGRDGSLAKRHVLDLAAIPDPDLVSLPPINPGDIRLGDPFSVVCESVEAIRVLDRNEVLVGCDNNFPNSGRSPGRPDDNELITVRVPAL